MPWSENLRLTVENLLAPLLSAQIFLMVLIYFSVVRKKVTAEYQLYICFLAIFTLYLIGRPIQELFGSPEGPVILLIRMAMLFSVAIPCLLIATARQSGIRLSGKLALVPFLIGAVISLGYIVFADAGMLEFVFTKEMLSWVNHPRKMRIAHAIQGGGAAIMLIIPCGWLMFREWNRDRDYKLLAFLFGALWLGSLTVFGASSRIFGLYYLGSMVSALCWGWAVFQDIRDMKGRASLLKDELFFVAKQGGASDNALEIEQLLSRLESHSQDNLAVYKMRIHQILDMLTDSMIEAGGDVETLIQRNAERNREVETQRDPVSVRNVARREVVALSELMAGLPEKEISAIDKAVKYLKQNYIETINVEELATKVGVSRSHFMREFKKEIGQTVTQYQTSLRMNKAQELLASTSVTDTAFAVGYNNSSYFSTVFKKHTGMSPAVYQKSLHQA